MQRQILLGVGGLSLVTAAYIGGATQHWYENVPGVVLTGPLNFHFAQDVALAYLLSGGMLLWAGHKNDKSVGVCGAGWLVLHAMLHIWMWIHRGVPLDIVALTNLLGIQMPALLAFFAAINIQAGGKQA
ncbi:hypothetical protein [Flavimaricola marinus]|uniref:DoxX n=1 Tax=Flavimaricola marinus TaxID=1819565 RepID=A0A238LMW7_9RHOB|nr:hypothetical protein [Flavimaricola marinus]SMY10160.1 hypothetical protein LOM8899_04335 [Flavimaricola marinus]